MVKIEKQQHIDAPDFVKTSNQRWLEIRINVNLCWKFGKRWVKRKNNQVNKRSFDIII